MIDTTAHESACRRTLGADNAKEVSEGKFIETMPKHAIFQATGKPWAMEDSDGHVKVTDEKGISTTVVQNQYGSPSAYHAFFIGDKAWRLRTIRIPHSSLIHPTSQ